MQSSRRKRDSATPSLMAPLPDDVVVHFIIAQANLGFLSAMTMVSQRWRAACAKRISRLQQTLIDALPIYYINTMTLLSLRTTATSKSHLYAPTLPVAALTPPPPLSLPFRCVPLPGQESELSVVVAAAAGSGSVRRVLSPRFAGCCAVGVNACRCLARNGIGCLTFTCDCPHVEGGWWRVEPLLDACLVHAVTLVSVDDDATTMRHCMVDDDDDAANTGQRWCRMLHKLDAVCDLIVAIKSKRRESRALKYVNLVSNMWCDVDEWFAGVIRAKIMRRLQSNERELSV